MRRDVAIIGVALVAIGLAPPRPAATACPSGASMRASPASRPPAPPHRYVTLPAGRDTVVARVRRDGGEVLRSRVVPGSFTVPAVALDGSPSGLSADGRTLVLISPRPAFPRARTTFAVLAPRRLAVRGDRHARRRLQLRRAVARRRARCT